MKPIPFFTGMLEELEKKGACICKSKDCPGGKKCPEYDMKKKAMCGKPHGKEKGKPKGSLAKKAMDIKAKIQAAKKDPSTKANPKDTGPPGSGLQDPRAQAMKGRGFGKGAGVIGRDVYKKLTGKEKIPLFGKGGLIGGGKKKKEKKDKKGQEKKAAEDAFFGGFDQALGKDAETAVPRDIPGAGGVRKEVAGILKLRRKPSQAAAWAAKGQTAPTAQAFRSRVSTAFKKRLGT
jgi:hypothetical protein